MTKAREIMERAAKTLQDPGYVRWTQPEMLDWISEAQVAIARNPGAYSKTKVIQLSEGTRQELPDDAWGLVTVVCNVDEDGTPLLPVRLVTRSLLDTVVPRWHLMAERPEVENYTYDDRFPKQFYVYPPNDGEGHVEVVYMGIPKDVESPDQELELDDTFVPALINYVLFRATSKESDYSAGVNSAQQYFSAYSSELSAALSQRQGTTPTKTLSEPGPVTSSGDSE